ncbi:neprilysin-2-like [Rhopalosiphum padi]|uniref:neprilysin-2-like n=1 Tax=Rhopalosiphum padi TaxID=40932 RepID=UPI00298EA0E7|nr:neprilysin-2-like [Rhopalosiphum padi]
MTIYYTSSSALKMTDQPVLVIEKPTWWKRRTNKERYLTVATAGMLLASAFLALTMMYLNHGCNNTESLPSISAKNNGINRKTRSLYENKEYEINNTICVTAGCVKAAASVIKNMDLSVDPCDDFYQFACGNFKKHIAIDSGLTSHYTRNDNNMRNKLLMVITEPIYWNEQKPFKMAKLLYKFCMDTETIEEDDLESIKKIIKNLGGWPVLESSKWDDTKFTWMESVYKFRMVGYSIDYFISFYINEDLKNNTMRIIELDQAILGLQQKYLVMGISNKFVNAYYEYMVDIAELFDAYRPQAITELRESLDFEIELAKISLPSEKRKNATELYHPMNISDLQQRFPSIPWQEYLNNILNPMTIRQDEIIVVTSPKYLSDLEILLSKTPKRVQANYVFWRAIMDSVSLLTKKLRKRQLDYENTINDGNSNTQSRWRECLDIIYEYFQFPVMSLYVRQFYDEHYKNNILEMVKGIREEKYKILSSIDWLDDETRKNAIDKAKSITNHIAYPDELLDDNKLNAYYENLEFDNKDFLTSILKVCKFETDLIMNKLRQPVNKSEWISHSDLANVNAFHYFEENSIEIPVGILQDVFYSSDRPQYMNYGAIGTIIGHEINHGFDTNGRKYDKQGNLVDWWTKEVENRYLEKAMCIQNQYGNYTAQEVGLKLNGSNTQDENIADNSGFKEAYNAYNSWTKQHGVEPRLPGLQKYTPKQMFWLSTANMRCNKYSRETLKYDVINGSHSPNRFRIIGPLSNLEEFSNDFQCKPGSYMNPVKKCQIW